MQLKVDCYSGYRADERPLRFTFLAGAKVREFEVREVVDRWYGVGYECFKVRADDEDVYILRHNLGKDSWCLDAFRQRNRELREGLNDK